MGFLSGIGSAFTNAIPSAVGSFINGYFSTKNTNSVNESNERIANQNIEFQRENLEYQKALQQQLFEREDTSYQRTVDDMRSAGLSPLSMQNTNGAGEAIATNAINNNMQYQKSQAFEDLGNSLMNLASNGVQLDLLRSQAKKARSEASIAETEDEIKKFDIMFNGIEKIQDLLSKSTLNRSQKLQLENDLRQAQYNNLFGIVNGMTDKERSAAILNRSLFNDVSDNVFDLTFPNDTIQLYGDKNARYLSHNLFSGSSTPFQFKNKNQALEEYKSIQRLFSALLGVDVVGDVLDDLSGVGSLLETFKNISGKGKKRR